MQRSTNPRPKQDRLILQSDRRKKGHRMKGCLTCGCIPPLLVTMPSQSLSYSASNKGKLHFFPLLKNVNLLYTQSPTSSKTHHPTTVNTNEPLIQTNPSKWYHPISFIGYLWQRSGGKMVEKWWKSGG